MKHLLCIHVTSLIRVATVGQGATAPSLLSWVLGFVQNWLVFGEGYPYVVLYFEGPIPMFFFFSKTWLINSWRIVVSTKFPETIHKSPIFLVYPIYCGESWWDAWATSESPLDARHIPIQPYTKIHCNHFWPLSGCLGPLDVSLHVAVSYARALLYATIS